MNTMDTSGTGLKRETSERRWNSVAPADTTPEAHAQYEAWWQGLSGSERATWWLQRVHQMDQLRMKLLSDRNPGVSQAELMARWTEETYRGTVDAGSLARACEAIRKRG